MYRCAPCQEKPIDEPASECQLKRVGDNFEQRVQKPLSGDNSAAVARGLENFEADVSVPCGLGDEVR
jgi:hypothetical protein